MLIKSMDRMRNAIWFVKKLGLDPTKIEKTENIENIEKIEIGIGRRKRRKKKNKVGLV
jgi:hypothetical protein